MTAEAGIDTFKLRRFIAAYKLRLAEKAEALGARPETWGQDQTISIEQEKSYLSREDQYRLAPYPFPGLRSFERDEGELFFGRERNVETLRGILAECRLVVVLGGSGSGKSSLVRAGLLPFLNTERRIKGRDGNWYSIDFRPRTDPFGELSSALVDQVLRPLLRMRRKGLPQALGLPDDVDTDSIETIKLLRERTRKRFAEARKLGRQQVLNTLLEIVDQELDTYDNIVTRGRRLASPNLFLLVDQLEEVFRPEIAKDEREALLDLIVDLHSHMQDTSQRGGLFLAATIRSEEVYRCAEHRGLSDVVIGRGGYQIELLDPKNEEDKRSIRAAIIQPARNVFRDWGLEQYLDHDDAPFEKGLPDLLLKGAERLSVELSHRPDQLPLLQHALQATWHAAIRRWSNPNSGSDRLEITRKDVPGQAEVAEFPDLSACLKARADKAKDRAVERFVETIGGNKEVGVEALRAAFRSLARRDDQGNWARRFAGRDEITAFLTADPASAVAKLQDEPRWNALREALRVFLLRGYLSQGTERKFDISHEALIRNWPLFLDWLREPEEVAYALGRVMMEVEPAEYEKATLLEKMRLVPQELADRVATVAEGGALPTRWGEDQIAPYLQRPALRKRWGEGKHEALLRLTKIAASAKRAQVLKTALSFVAFLIVGGVILGALYSAGKSQLKVQQAELDRKISFTEAEASAKYAKEAAAYSLIGSMQYQTNWPDGLRERTAIHALTMLNGGGQQGNQALMHVTAWQNWDTGVRNLLGQTLRVETSTVLAPVAVPACRTFSGSSAQNSSDRETLTSTPVALAGAPGTEVRFYIAKSDTGSARLFFETRKNGGNWAVAEEETSFDPIDGLRLCLAPNGAALTISYRGSSFPNLFELNWYACLGDQACGEDPKWHVVRRQIVPSPLASARGGTFSCVRAVRTVPLSKKALSRIEVDFTDETLEKCADDGGAAADPQSNPKLLRGTYLPGIARPTLYSGSGLGNPGKFTECQGDNASRQCELSDGLDRKLTLTLTHNYSDFWSISINPVDPDYPISGVQLVAPLIKHAAVDEHKNIWLGDDKGHSWILINDRAALMNELWGRVGPLLQNPAWVAGFSEVKMNMTAEEINSRGPLAAAIPEPAK